MALPRPRPPERSDAGEPERRARLLAEFDELRRRIREQNPDLDDDGWSALADEWSGAVDEALRQRVRRLRADGTGDAAP